MKCLLTYLFFFAFVFGVNGQVKLAVQKAHSDNIAQLQFSNSGRYLVSMGANSEFVIWDLFHEKSITSFSLSQIEDVQGMKFTEDESKLMVKTARTTFFYNLSEESFLQENISDTNYRSKTVFYDSQGYKVDVFKGTVRKRKLGKRLAKYKLGVSSEKTPFTSFAVSEEANLLVAIAENEVIYVYNYQKGSKKKELAGHFSAVNDVCFTKDGKYFATAGNDRSIIIWESATLKMKTRLSSNVYRKKTVEFSYDGNRIFVGDELGYIYTIDFSSAFPQISVVRPGYHSINKIQRRNGPRKEYFILSSDNHVYVKNDPMEEAYRAKFPYRDHGFLNSKKRILERVFNTYQTPIGEPFLLSQSPNAENIVYSGSADFPGINFVNLKHRKIKRVYNYYDSLQWKDIGFTSDSTFIGMRDSSNILYHWMIDGKDIFVKTDTLPFVLEDFEVVSADELWLNTKHHGQFTYNMKTRIPVKVMDLTVTETLKHKNFVILETNSNALVFYDFEKEEIYNRFIGHKENVTDLSFHPNGDLFVTSSDDGTVRLWSLKDKRSLVTILPFKNKEFVFVTGDNYYLVTKGAMDEIGFKANDQYFYPEQFDLKYNRPDIVLSKMGFSHPNLIEAYEKAYLKRLKKMNFTEEQISAEFHLPTAEILNREGISKTTSSDSLKLKLHFEDDKFSLDRINVWINDVAIFGINGIDIREMNRKKLDYDLSMELAQGRNKVEISVLNSTGAESYKSTVTVEKEKGGKRSDLFIASIGISKHEDSRYDLEYADKDARDIVSVFSESNYFNNVESMTLTNDEVKKENLSKLKAFLSQAKIDDVVLVFIAGHGVLNENFDYFFATHDMDFENPQERGVPYESIEQLLDGIKALKKLLFIDTCHSGELDKDEIEEDDEDEDSEGDIIFRSVGKSVKLKDNPLGLQNTNDLMKSLFTDLRKGTGATVISSSGGTELSIEGNNYKNGLFTYCLLNGLTSGEADLNNDKVIFISELQQYVQREVNLLSNGLQTPTSRIQNNELDYRIW